MKIKTTINGFTRAEEPFKNHFWVGGIISAEKCGAVSGAMFVLAAKWPRALAQAWINIPSSTLTELRSSWSSSPLSGVFANLNTRIVAYQSTTQGLNDCKLFLWNIQHCEECVSSSTCNGLKTIRCGDNRALWYTMMSRSSIIRSSVGS